MKNINSMNEQALLNLLSDVPAPSREKLIEVHQRIQQRLGFSSSCIYVDLRMQSDDDRAISGAGSEGKIVNMRRRRLLLAPTVSLIAASILLVVLGSIHTRPSILHDVNDNRRGPLCEINGQSGPVFLPSVSQLDKSDIVSTVKIQPQGLAHSSSASFDCTAQVGAPRSLSFCNTSSKDIPNENLSGADCRDSGPDRTSVHLLQSASIGIAASTSKRVVRGHSIQVRVQPGDSLCKIASRETGNAANWLELYRRNQATIGKSPDRLRTGTVINIPFQLAVIRDVRE